MSFRAKYIATGEALLYATIKNDLAEVRKLIGGGADVNYRGYSDHTALDPAAYYGHINLVDYLILNDADVLATNKEGETAMDKAIRGRDRNLDSEEGEGGHRLIIIRLAKQENKIRDEKELEKGEFKELTERENGEHDEK